MTQKCIIFVFILLNQHQLQFRIDVLDQRSNFFILKNIFWNESKHSPALQCSSIRAIALPVQKDCSHPGCSSWCVARFYRFPILRGHYRWGLVDVWPQNWCENLVVASAYRLSSPKFFFIVKVNKAIELPWKFFQMSKFVCEISLEFIVKWLAFKLIVFNSANRYKSMKYSWQNRQAPFRLPSMVDAWKNYVKSLWCDSYKTMVWNTMRITIGSRGLCGNFKLRTEKRALHNFIETDVMMMRKTRICLTRITHTK